MRQELQAKITLNFGLGKALPPLHDTQKQQALLADKGLPQQKMPPTNPPSKCVCVCPTTCD